MRRRSILLRPLQLPLLLLHNFETFIYLDIMTRLYGLHPLALFEYDRMMTTVSTFFSSLAIYPPPGFLGFLSHERLTIRPLALLVIDQILRLS